MKQTTKNDWLMSEKHYITKEELIEFAKVIWFEATEGHKPDSSDKRIIKDCAEEEMLRMWWRDADWKL